MIKRLIGPFLLPSAVDLLLNFEQLSLDPAKSQHLHTTVEAPDRWFALDGDFRVHGVSGLRVVDASVFPRIPGFFIASAVYMIGEKAAEVMLADARVSSKS